MNPAPPFTDPAATPTKPFDLPGLLARTGRDSAYVLTSLPIAVLTFSLALTGLTAGIGTLIIWIGVPVLFGTLLTAGHFARLERWRLGRLRRTTAHRPHYLAEPRERPVRQMTTVLRDPQRWLDVVWGIVSFASSLIVFVVGVIWWALAVGGPVAAVWTLISPDSYSDGLFTVTGVGDGLFFDTQFLDAWVNGALGLIALVSLPWVMRGLAWAQAALADVVLNSRSELDAQVRRADGARAAAQQAEAASFRRLERDIHDGPQQRLVRLTMDLGRAKRQLDNDPEKAGELLDDALRQARDTLDELRSLSRGIAPPLLVDRGLGVALDELVVRSAVPVEMTHSLPSGLSPHVETAVYFTVSEALTNVAKHSGATTARVDVHPDMSTDMQTDGGTLLVQISDAGVGGAHPGKGQGLAGLAQRITAVEGTLDVDSPAGGPTVVTARIPLA